MDELAVVVYAICIALGAFVLGYIRLRSDESAWFRRRSRHVIALTIIFATLYPFLSIRYAFAGGYISVVVGTILSVSTRSRGNRSTSDNVSLE